MEITLLVKSIMGLVVILGILIFLFVFQLNGKKESKKIKKSPIKKQKNVVKHELQGIPKGLDLKGLSKILRDPASDTKKLKETLDLILKNYGTIPKKLGTRAHPEFDRYMEILFSITRHPKTNKDLILHFNKELAKKNPDYAQNIEEAVMKGLNSRR